MSLVFAGSPLIMNNEISNNLATGVFGALQGIPTDPNNDAIATGGGITIDNNSTPILVQNVIIQQSGGRWWGCVRDYATQRELAGLCKQHHRGQCLDA